MAASANWKPLLTNDCPIQPLAPFILKKRKTLVALALATAATGFAGLTSRASTAELYPSQKQAIKTTLIALHSNPQLNDPAVWDLQSFEQLMALLGSSQFAALTGETQK